MTPFLLIALITLSIILWRLYGLYKKLRTSYTKTLQERTLVLSFLQEIGTAFTEEIGLGGLLHSVVNSSIRMLGASSGALFLLDAEKSNLQAVIVNGTFPPWECPEPVVLEKILSKNKYLEEYIKAQKIPVGTGLIGCVVSTGKSVFISDGKVDIRIPKPAIEMLEIRTMLVVPLKIKDEVLGVLALVNKTDNLRFSETDLSLLLALGDQAAIAIRNAKFYETVIEKQKLDRDLNIAKEIQYMLLPKSYPRIEGWDIHAWTRSAMEIGGDYYDFIEVGKDKFGIVIADVSGKSIPGALVMNTTRSLLRSKAVGVHSASGLLIAVNELLCQDIDPGMFVSLLYLIIDTSKNTLTYVRAGHEPLLLFRAKEGTCELVKPDGMVLGVDDSALFNNSIREVEIPLAANDIIVLYTDGVTEAVNKKKEEFGMENLMDAVRVSAKSTADGIVNNIAERVNRFTGAETQQDDLTLVVLKVR